jgi:hypothetical protein
VRPWDPDILRLELRARAEQVRRVLRQLAEARGLRFSFEVTRGDVPAVLAAGGGAGVLTAVMAGGRSAYPIAAERSRTDLVQVLLHSRGVTLIHREGHLQRLPVLVYYTGSPSARRALAVVGAFKRGRREEVRVLLPPAAAETSMRLLDEVESWRREYGQRVITQQLASARAVDLARTLRQFSHSLIVLPGRAPVLRGEVARGVLDAASAVLVVRG